MLDPMFESAWRVPLAVFALLVACGFELRSFWLFRLGLGDSDHPEAGERVVAAFRSAILAVGFLCFAGGLWFKAGWPIGFAVFFLAEEMVETGFMSLVLRSGRDKVG